MTLAALKTAGSGLIRVGGNGWQEPWAHPRVTYSLKVRAKVVTEGRLTLTIPEFSRLAGISKNQAYALAATDSLGVPIIRLGRRMVLSRKAVLALLEGNGNEHSNG